VYIGAAVSGYLGGADIDITDHSVLYGVELGYGLRVPAGDGNASFFTLRPQVGVGGVTIFHTDPSTLASTGGTRAAQPDVVTTASGRTVSGRSARSDTTMVDNVYVQPAIVALYTWGGPFVGLGLNMLIVPNLSYSGSQPETWISYGAQAQLGYVF
jgi:hypothetical protein